jgi:hypothetical protein
MCDTGVVGDEHHVVFACPALAAVRTPDAPLFPLGSKTVMCERTAKSPDLDGGCLTRVLNRCLL